jgi:hypothetical protein
VNDDLSHEIIRLTGALRQHNAARGAGWGLAIALSVELIAALAARITPLWYRPELLLMLVWAIGFGLLAGAMVGYIWPHPLPRRLRFFDRQLLLADRLTTAWELIQGHIHAPDVLAQLQREETLRAVRAIDPRPAFPLQPQRASILLTLALTALLVSVLFLDNPQEAVLTHREAQRQATETAIEQLEAAQDKLAKDTMLTEAERDAALKALEEALAALQNRSSTPEEQQAALTEAERQLAKLASPKAEARVQRLAEAAPLSTEAVVQPLTEALQQGDVESAAEYLRDLLDPTQEQPLTPEEMLALADAFEQIAATLQKSDAALAEQFQDIAQEIYSKDVAGAQEAIEQAAATLSEVAQASAPNQTLEQTQASLQQAQEGLSEAQRQSTGQAPSDSAMAQPGGTGAQEGQGAGPAGQADDGQTGSGTGSSGHNEDSGSSAPYGSEETSRITGEGGKITLPRQETYSDPQTVVGLPGNARIPYQDVYATYVEAAEADLNQNVYPPALRIYVREYFSGLEP